ncbi:hypothetical protein [Streptomyces sp. ID05-47C]|uniref:hypothetical protein n=1 Tax=Streptomyces sp. ID05-47C TaxID=3028665 RepID=UPI0029BE9EE6|nr:hypothetical protein [Streptomyces sp. ID05-47C]MDX3571976.1 hypothetical protein [Streptomyces sp. ID05-47C]
MGFIGGDKRGIRGVASRAAVAAICAALVVSCTSGSRDSGRREPADARQFDLLVSEQNGYYYHPFLRQEPAGPQAQSYALRTLAELGRDPRTGMAGERVASFRREALEASPLWGREWLVPLWRTGAREALGAGDAADVNRLRAAGGWYVDPALGDDGDAARLGATWAALEVLDALGRLPELPAADRAATVSWLRATAGRVRALDQAGALARSLRLLKEPVPAPLTRVAAPRTDDFADLTPETRAVRLDDTYSYVLLQEAAGKRPAVDRRIWEPVLRDGAATLPYEQLHNLVHILKAAGSPNSAFAPVLKRLDGERLDDGTVRDPDAYLGSPDASLFVQRLRALAGWSREDPALLTALRREETSGEAGQEGPERLNRAALRTVTEGGGDASEPARQLCADPRVLPATVTETNATPWQRTALTCTDAGVTTGVPEIGRWRADTPERVVAAATVVVGLADSGRRDAVPSWIDAGTLKRWALHPDRFTSVYGYALVVRAYALLGGRLDAALREALGRGVTPYEGCPGLPGLYRVGGGDEACDLKTTWSVWTLDRQLDGAMGWLPAGATKHGK